MIQFDIPGMTCGGCARSVTKAIHSIDADARVVPEGSEPALSRAG